jgi:hypothetical protein
MKNKEKKILASWLAILISIILFSYSVTVMISFKALIGITAIILYICAMSFLIRSWLKETF